MDKLQKQREASKRWYEKHKNELSLKRKGTRSTEHRSYYQRNKEYMCEKAKQWRLLNPDKVKEIQKRSRSSNDTRRLFNLVRSRSKKKGILFDLTKEYIQSLITDKCPYLGVKYIYGDYNYSMSIDRINPTGGYIMGNVEVISTKANRMKNTASREELIMFANNILLKYEDVK